MKNISIGIDIGGHHIACAAINLDNFSIIENSHFTTKVDNKATADEILLLWCDTISKTLSAFDKSALKGIGFAMPGPFDYVNGIGLFTHDVQKFEHLYNVNIVSELKTRLQLDEDISVRFINDATAFGIAETWIGKAKNHTNAMALTLGTGFGSAFFRNGIPVIDDEDVPQQGCLWHLPFKSGIADDSFSTRWFVNNFNEKSSEKVAGVKEIADKAYQGNELALSLFNEYGQNMADFLLPWVEKFKATSIVIGGNIVGAFDLFGNKLNDTFKSKNISVEISISELMEMGAIVGSARLVDDSYYPKVLPLLSKM